MPTIETLEGEQSTPSQLVKIFGERLNVIVDRHPDKVTPGRPRVNAFAKLFEIHYSTADRLLACEGLPSVTLLARIAQTFNTTESWLLGRNTEDQSTSSPYPSVQIRNFSELPEGLVPFGMIAQEIFPPGFDSSNLLFTRVREEGESDEDVIVKVSTKPENGKVHLFHDPVTARRFLRRVTFLPEKKEYLCGTLKTGNITIVKFENVLLGEPESDSKLCIVGPVVARIKYFFKGD